MVLLVSFSLADALDVGVSALQLAACEQDRKLTVTIILAFICRYSPHELIVNIGR